MEGNEHEDKSTRAQSYVRGTDIVVDFVGRSSKYDVEQGRKEQLRAEAERSGNGNGRARARSHASTLSHTHTHHKY